MGSSTFTLPPDDNVEAEKNKKDMSQSTFTKLRKVVGQHSSRSACLFACHSPLLQQVAFLPKTDRVVWLGYSEGRCVALWKLCGDGSEAAEPFEELCSFQLEIDPCDMWCVSSVGDFALFSRLFSQKGRSIPQQENYEPVSKAAEQYTGIYLLTSFIAHASSARCTPQE